MRTTFSLVGGRSVAADQQQQQQQQSEHQRQQSQQDTQLSRTGAWKPIAGLGTNDLRRGRSTAANSALADLVDVDCFDW